MQELAIRTTVTSSLECFILTYTNYVLNFPIRLRYVNFLNKRKSINQSINQSTIESAQLLDV